MWCPKCGMDTRVVETEKLNKTVSRVRWCRNAACRHLFETHEVVATGRTRKTLEVQTGGKPQVRQSPLSYSDAPAMQPPVSSSSGKCSPGV
jgi:hypothetical protein